MEKQELPKLYFSHLVSCKTLRRPNDNFEYWGVGWRNPPQAYPKADEEFAALEPFEEGKCWQSSLSHSHRACVHLAELCYPFCMGLIDLKLGPGVDTDLWLRWTLLWWPRFRSKEKQLQFEPFWRNIIEFLMNTFYWTDDLRWAGKA